MFKKYRELEEVLLELKVCQDSFEFPTSEYKPLCACDTFFKLIVIKLWSNQY